MPIVCVNIDGYYDNFLTILERAHKEEMLYKHPSEIVHFETTPEAAVRWVEDFLADTKNLKEIKAVKRRSSVLKRMESNLSGDALSVWGRMASFFGEDAANTKDSTFPSRSVLNGIIVFTAGFSLGLLVAMRTSSK